jgi:hypothetical protein
MQVARAVMSDSVLSLMLFGVCALLLAFAGGGNIDRAIVRLIIELPLLLLVAAIFIFPVNLVGWLIGPVATGSRLVGALVAVLLAWLIAGPPEFAGLGYHTLLRPAFAVAVLVPWVLRSNPFARAGSRRGA